MFLAKYVKAKNILSITKKLTALIDVGLGYIKLGQPSTTLSVREAQRRKLASELSKCSTVKTFYVFDELTTKLHVADVHQLINVIRKLVNCRNIALVVEHNLDIIEVCDYIIDLGPEGGEKGGNVIATGTPEEIVKNSRSYTGYFLNKLV